MRDLPHRHQAPQAQGCTLVQVPTGADFFFQGGCSSCAPSPSTPSAPEVHPGGPIWRRSRELGGVGAGDGARSHGPRRRGHAGGNCRILGSKGGRHSSEARSGRDWSFPEQFEHSTPRKEACRKPFSPREGVTKFTHSARRLQKTAEATPSSARASGSLPGRESVCKAAWRSLFGCQFLVAHSRRNPGFHAIRFRRMSAAASSCRRSASPAR